MKFVTKSITLQKTSDSALHIQGQTSSKYVMVVEVRPKGVPVGTRPTRFTAFAEDELYEDQIEIFRSVFGEGLKTAVKEGTAVLKASIEGQILPEYSTWIGKRVTQPVPPCFQRYSSNIVDASNTTVRKKGSYILGSDGKPRIVDAITVTCLMYEDAETGELTYLPGFDPKSRATSLMTGKDAPYVPVGAVADVGEEADDADEEDTVPAADDDI